MEVDGTFESLTKKEVARLNKEKVKLEKNLGGIKEMKDLPGIVFIIDTKKETNAVEEAKKMKIPIVAVVDTNCNPQGIDFPIPGNDDAIRSITLFTQIVANAVVEADNETGLKIIENLQEEETAATAVGVEEPRPPEEETIVVSDFSEYKPAEPEKKPEESQDQDAVTAMIDTDKLYEDK
jgi:small subunit ribosomal protein S2